MLPMDKLTVKTQEVLESCLKMARERSHQQVDVEHLMLSLLDVDGTVVVPTLEKIGTSVPSLRNDIEKIVGRYPQVQGQNVQPYLSPRLNSLFDAAEKEARDLKDEYISVEHLLLAASQDQDSAFKQILNKYGINRHSLLNVLKEVRGVHNVTDQTPENKYQALEKYGRDLTALAKQGKLDPVIGRDAEIRRAIQVLSRRTKNNPVLIGDPGTGKTAIAEGLARRIANGDV